MTPTATAAPGARLLTPTDHTLILIDFQSQMASATHSISANELRTNASLVAQQGLDHPDDGGREELFRSDVRRDHRACGDVSAEAHDRAIDRMVQAGAQPMSSLQYLLELQRDWARGDTCELTTGIARKVGGAYGIGIHYARTMFGAHEG